MTMTRTRRLRLALLLLFAALGAVPRAQAPAPPAPAPDPGAEPNIFYGAAAPGSNPKAAVLVFVHGLRGTASDWWELSDMYALAYSNGFRTAFVSMSLDNSRNDAGIEANAAVLRNALPRIAQRFGVEKMYLVGHSKGGVDIQAALLTPSVARLAKAVFTISTPNYGTELANWAFEHPDIAGPPPGLDLLSEGVASMRTDAMLAFRAIADPVLRASGIPFYTLAGNTFLDSAGTAITGTILRGLTPNQNNDSFNDGFVPVGRTRLPGTYAADLGTVSANHFRTNGGSVSFPKLRSIIMGLELTFAEFERIAVDGISEWGGDAHNTWAWSMKWFKGALYVGTARENLCTSLLTSDVRTGTKVYPLSVLSTQCPDVPTLLSSLGAEIWRYTPDNGQWFRVFKSPDSIPTGFDGNGNAIGFTARDIGFRGMEVHVEPDGTEALYVGSVTSGSLLERSPFQPNGYPGPRLLRTVDGLQWGQVPMAPGTFLYEIGNALVDPVTKYRSFRSLVSYNGKLFASVADFIGVGVVVASANPAAGNNEWHYASPVNRLELPVWSLIEFNGFLYATTGLTRDQDPSLPGYGVYKTDATGPAPYTWTPVVTGGGEQGNPAYRSPNGLSMAVFKNQLYVGTNRPTELLRINPDDTWEIVAGEPRMTSSGFKAPISGLGNGFGSWFNGHFWRMAAHGDYLYLTTWDWSVGLQQFSLVGDLDKLFNSNYGFDMYRSRDGVHWTAVTKTGFGDPNNSGGRSIESTPAGLFVGTARQRGGIMVLRSDGPAPDPAHLPAPKDLKAESEFSVGRTVSLQWSPVPGAVAYQVYQMPVKPIDQLFQSSSMNLADGEGSALAATLADIKAGKYDGLCSPDAPLEDALCAGLAQVKALDLQADDPLIPAAFPLPPRIVAVTQSTVFTQPAPSVLQSLYFIRAQDASGNLSMPSNLVGGPSKGVDSDSAPVALCAAVTVQAPADGCSVPAASIDDGSFDPNNQAVTIAQEPAGPYPLGATEVTLTVSNGVASQSCSATVTVVDATPPTIVAPADISATTSGSTATIASLGTPVVSDNCEAPSITNDAPAGNIFPLGATVVTWTATDAGGGTASDTQTVTVEAASAPASLTCDIDRDADVDRADIAIISAARYTTPVASDPRDANRDLRIDVADVRFCQLKCTRPYCAM